MLRNPAAPIPGSRGLWRGFAAALLLGIPGSNLSGGMFVCLLRVLSGRGLCVGPIISCPEESYRVSCV